jgi:hypothetical protein
MLLIFKATVIVTTSELLESTQDGGKCSDTRTTLLPMREEKSWQSKEDLTLRTETLVLKSRMARSTKDGELSMLTNMRKSQPRVNLTRSSDFTLREISTLSQHSQITNILISLITETW